MNRAALPVQREDGVTILDSILDFIAAGKSPTLADLGGSAVVAAEWVRLKNAPMLDVLVELAAEDSTGLLPPLLPQAFSDNMDAASLREGLDLLLTFPELIKQTSQELKKILHHRVEQRRNANGALIAAYCLEGLFRLALTGAITRHRAIALLSEVDADEPTLFAPHAAKLAGAAYHIWREQDLADTLERLLTDPDAEEEASFELGLIWLSRALEKSELTSALEQLESARVHLVRCIQLSEDRDDARAYRCVIDLIRELARGSRPGEITSLTNELERTIRRRGVWLYRPELREWLRPRLDRDLQWLRLARSAQVVAGALNRDSWLNAYEIMDHVLSVYDAERTIGTAQGWTALVSPSIESAFLRHKGLLAHLDDLISDPSWLTVQKETAVCLRKQIAARARDGAEPSAGDNNRDPLLTSVVGQEEVPLPVNIQAQLETALNDRRMVTDWTGDSVVQRIFATLTEGLVLCDHYGEEVRADFDDLLLHVILFCRSRLDASAKELGQRGAYRFRADAKESDLQTDLWQFLAGNFLKADVRTEVPGIAAGRTDVYVSLGGYRFVLELKKEMTDSSPDHLRKHLLQSAAYQATNVRLGFLGVLDLTRQSGPPPHLEENFWLEQYIPPAASQPRYIVVFRVPGLLARPSSLTRTKPRLQ